MKIIAVVDKRDVFCTAEKVFKWSSFLFDREITTKFVIWKKKQIKKNWLTNSFRISYSNLKIKLKEL